MREIGAQRIAILASEGKPAIAEISEQQRTIRRRKLLDQPAVGEEADIGIERRRAGAGKGGRIAAAADKGEIGFGQVGEAVGEQRTEEHTTELQSLMRRS